MGESSMIGSPKKASSQAKRTQKKGAKSKGAIDKTDTTKSAEQLQLRNIRQENSISCGRHTVIPSATIYDMHKLFLVDKMCSTFQGQRVRVL